MAATRSLAATGRISGRRLLVQLILGISIAAGEGTVVDASIIDLGSANFSEHVSAAGARVLVSFFAPWCAHSQKLAPQYTAAAEKLRDARKEDPTLVGRLARVDATENTALASSYGVRGYPTLIWFADGEPRAYQGTLKTADVVDWVMRRGGPLIASLDSKLKADAFRLSYDVAVVATLSNATERTGINARALATLEAVCRSLAEVPVRCGTRFAEPEESSSAQLPDEEEKPQPALPSVVVYRATDDAIVPYAHTLGAAAQAGDEAEALRKFVVSESLPPVVTFSYASQAAIFESGVDLLVFLLEPHKLKEAGEAAAATEADDDALGAAFGDAARALRGAAIFVRVDTSAHAHTVGRYFAPHPSDALLSAAPRLPALAIYSKAAHSRHVSAVTPSAAGIEADVRRALSGQAPPLRRTTANEAAAEAVAIDGAGRAASPAAGLVSSLRGATFEREWRRLHRPEGPAATAPSRDVLILLTASWCTGCAAVEEAFHSLAAARADDERLRFAQMDVSGDEPPAALRVRELPSVLLLVLRAGAGTDPRLEDAEVRRCCGGDAPGAEAIARFVENSRVDHRSWSCN